MSPPSILENTTPLLSFPLAYAHCITKNTKLAEAIIQVFLELYWKWIIKNYINCGGFLFADTTLLQKVSWSKHHCKFSSFISWCLKFSYSFSPHINTEASFYIALEKMQPFKRRQAVLFPNKIVTATPHVRLTQWLYTTIPHPWIQLRKQEIVNFFLSV